MAAKQMTTMTGRHQHHQTAILLLILLLLNDPVTSFVPLCSHLKATERRLESLGEPAASSSLTAKGFGAASSNKKKKKGNSNKQRLTNALEDKPSTRSSKTKKPSKNVPYNKSQQEDMIQQLQAKASQSVLGKAVASSPLYGTPDMDPFWELMPSLISSRFPNVQEDELTRIAGLLRHTLNPNLKPDEPNNEHDIRPLEDIHAYMPDLGPTQTFYDPNQLEFCQQLSKHYDVILQEYHALLADMETNGKDRFQSVTSMNYESGWKTLVLFYNGHRMDGFPYHLCPTTTRLLETMPLAGRIAGFNRQQPNTGIPRHTDGNNMWLTCQMGLIVPEDNAASITVGHETRHWKQAECLLYDTTYWHETLNSHPTQERVVLHVDFFNTLKMTPTEIEVLQYIYQLREQFMKAEGVKKVGAQIL